jgi:hypothetical protein
LFSQLLVQHLQQLTLVRQLLLHRQDKLDQACWRQLFQLLAV